MLLHKLDKSVVDRAGLIDRSGVSSGSAVDIAAKSDIILSAELKTMLHMLKVISNVSLIGIVADKSGKEVKTDHTALTDDLLSHIVGEVTAVGAERAEVRVSSDKGLLCKLSELPNKLSIE